MRVMGGDSARGGGERDGAGPRAKRERARERQRYNTVLVENETKQALGRIWADNGAKEGRRADWTGLDRDVEQGLGLSKTRQGKDVRSMLICNISNLLIYNISIHHSSPPSPSPPPHHSTKN